MVWLAEQPPLYLVALGLFMGISFGISFALLTVCRVIDRQRKQVQFLTRRVWFLEGENGANAERARREIEAEERIERARRAGASA